MIFRLQATQTVFQFNRNEGHPGRPDLFPSTSSPSIEDTPPDAPDSTSDRLIISTQQLIENEGYKNSESELLLLQQNLYLLGYDLGGTGKYQNGVDGVRQQLTNQAIQEFLDNSDRKQKIDKVKDNIDTPSERYFAEVLERTVANDKLSTAELAQIVKAALVANLGDNRDEITQVGKAAKALFDEAMQNGNLIERWQEASVEKESTLEAIREEVDAYWDSLLKEESEPARTPLPDTSKGLY